MDSFRSHSPQPSLWTHRGYLPHFHTTHRPQFITYRLADALPARVIARTKREVRHLPHEKQRLTRIRLLEKYMDQGAGRCLLRRPDLATIVIHNWRRFHGERYRLLEWVVMPNHVHLLILPFPGYRLDRILHGWKSYTANRINDTLETRGESRMHPLWQREYWDRYIRDLPHLRRTTAYIQHNPVHAGLCSTPEAWPYGSAACQAAP